MAVVAGESSVPEPFFGGSGIETRDLLDSTVGTDCLSRDFLSYCLLVPSCSSRRFWGCHLEGC